MEEYDLNTALNSYLANQASQKLPRTVPDQKLKTTGIIPLSANDVLGSGFKTNPTTTTTNSSNNTSTNSTSLAHNTSASLAHNTSASLAHNTSANLAHDTSADAVRVANDVAAESRHEIALAAHTLAASHPSSVVKPLGSVRASARSISTVYTISLERPLVASLKNAFGADVATSSFATPVPKLSKRVSLVPKFRFCFILELTYLVVNIFCYLPFRYH